MSINIRFSIDEKSFFLEKLTQLSIDDVITPEIAEELGNAVERVYQQGYEDGFEDGWNKGQRKALKDLS